MNIQMARFRIKSNCLAEFEEAAGRLLLAVNRKQFRGMYFAFSSLSDNVRRLALIEGKDRVKDRLPRLPTCEQFLVRLPSSIAGRPIREQLL